MRDKAYEKCRRSQIALSEAKHYARDEYSRKVQRREHAFIVTSYIIIAALFASLFFL